jgi:hypothetical protein
MKIIVLDDRHKRYFSYSYLKVFKKKSKVYGHLIPNSLFKKDRLFHTLEKHLSYISDKSLSKKMLEDLKSQDPHYVQMKKIFEGLLLHFHNNDFVHNACMRRIAGFFVLDFLQANYGLDIMGVAKGEDLEEKMKLMSSSFQLMKELKNLICYVENRRSSNPQMEAYCQISLSDRIKIYKFCILIHSIKKEHVYYLCINKISIFSKKEKNYIVRNQKPQNDLGYFLTIRLDLYGLIKFECWEYRLL